MQDIILHPIATVRNSRTEALDDHWSEIKSRIELLDSIPTESLDGIEQFSHLEILYFFHKSEKAMSGSEHPRENPSWPKVGIFAQRKKDRPNHLGSTIVKLISKEGRTLIVSNLDAIDETPVLDIKPVFQEYLPKGEILQPAWVSELMEKYW
ncbi:MAG: SAM-dependent methyltransferase [Bacteroidetes bacterium]|nr:SAM-dependent methyltransferase [Bacteroidota bacterium]